MATMRLPAERNELAKSGGAGRLGAGLEHEFEAEIVGDAGLQIGRRALGQHAPVVQDGQPVDRPFGLDDVVGHEQDCRALVGQRPNLRPQQAPPDGIDVVGRLVEDDQPVRERRPPCRTRQAA